MTQFKYSLITQHNNMSIGYRVHDLIRCVEYTVALYSLIHSYRPVEVELNDM